MTGVMRAIGRAFIAIQLALAFVIGSAGPGRAQQADEVQALVERAAAHVAAIGRERAFADFTRPDGGFIEGELHIFCNSIDGIVLAHGGNPKMVGRSFAEVRDGEGLAPMAELNRVGQTQGHGWVEYLWPNPVTRRIQRKVSYVVRIDDRTVCGSGYYLPASP